MADKSTETASGSTDDIVVDLRDPVIAALLAWIWPGLGHFYQRRWAKGAVFFVCVTGLFLGGLYVGGGNTVYAFDSVAIKERNWGPILQYCAQLGCGGPTFPSVVQGMRGDRQAKLWGGFMARPRGDANRHNELSTWHEQRGQAYDIGVLYTMVAGLLNILVIFDAYGGPLAPPPDPPKKDDKKEPPAKSDDPDAKTKPS